MKKQGIAILLVLLFMLWDGISFAEEDRITPFITVLLHRLQMICQRKRQSPLPMLISASIVTEFLFITKTLRSIKK